MRTKHRLYTLVVAFMVAATLSSCVSPGERKRMSELLTKAEKMNSDYVSMKNAVFMDSVLRFYDSHGTEEERIRANYMQGCVYRDKGNSPTALEYYMKAVNLADTTSNNCNYELLGRIYAQMAELFHKQRYPKKELEMWNNAITMARNAKDTLMAVHCLGRIASTYRLAGNKEKSADISKKTYKAFKALGEDALAASELATTISYNLERNALDESKCEIDEYVSKSGLVDKNGNMKKGCELFYYCLGEYYHKSCNIDSALYYYRKLVSYDKEIMNLENGYKGLMEVYMDLHQADSVVKYARLYADANDTANIRNSAKEVGRTQSLYDYSSHQQEALKKSKEVQNLWRILFFCFVASVLVLGTIYTFYIKYRKKVLAEKRELNSKYALALHDYNEALAEYKKYKENGASYEASLLEKIGELEKDLSMYRDNLDVDRLAWEQNLQKHQIVTIMHSHASKLTQPTTAEWSALIDVVGNHLPDFLVSLEATSVHLTDDELRVCVLTRIGFVPSEIAVLMDMTKQNVTNLRSRLNKKIFNEAGARTFTHNISKL
ncbi:hypothetical protein E5358_12580 [Palleniella muris]|uniref:Uncharacterized protein n=1 Tax=Palleniella muris TaxID=3038145 RepID=A0AC61QMR3_9BACT|nr:hypothetical protein [Palleniella muris]TGX80600.1 hypothetical protein E5358_12580 [Palleniella muris]